MSTLDEKKEVGRPRAFNSQEELEQKIMEYWQRCEQNNKPYTLSGLALWIGIDRRTLYNYSTRDEFFPTIKKAKDIVEASMEERALTGDNNVTFSIFALKNNFGWRDKQEIEHSGETSVNVNTNMTPEERKQRIEELKKKLNENE
ncbi:DNA-packaging protein [Clostridium saccharoperbutylacetonicum]|uniref:DNA-packaging protein n=1 Tax=Clostridium saccharoperbutylacetonicum TaxID=36745 RepID=UPI001FA7DE4F|nr:DNA-packaging protein [Clostridium saccharoperbutylacetonicum]